MSAEVGPLLSEWDTLQAVLTLYGPRRGLQLIGWARLWCQAGVLTVRDEFTCHEGPNGRRRIIRDLKLVERHVAALEGRPVGSLEELCRRIGGCVKKSGEDH